MFNKIKDLYKKYEEIINYIIIGGLTTVISLIAYFICTRTFLNPNINTELQIANIIKWIVGVLFAYVTNRTFVFKSKNDKILKEFVSFTLSRVSTLFLDMFIMWFMVIQLSIYDAIATIVSQILVIVGNYLISKFFVFKKKN